MLLEIKKINKSYLLKKNALQVIKNFSLQIMAGEKVSLLGPSGCGKTTILRMIAGLETVDSGQIFLRNKDVTKIAPEQRKVGLVFQDYALFPHLTVAGNIAFGLFNKNKEEKANRVDEMLNLVDLKGLGGRFIHQLSGGQQQRVALARALAPSPDLILLDEPFSNLDAALRRDTRNFVSDLLAQTKTGALLVTHDQEEALAFSDRLVIMQSGIVQQNDIPKNIYLFPENEFIAEFVGRANILNAQLDNNIAKTALGQLKCHPSDKQGEVKICLRPEHIELQSTKIQNTNNKDLFNEVYGIIITKEYIGAYILYTVFVENIEICVQQSSLDFFEIGEKVQINLKTSAHVLN